MDRVLYEVKLSFISPVLGLTPSNQFDLPYVLSKSKEELEKLERMIEKEKDEEKKVVLEERYLRLKTEIEEREIEDLLVNEERKTIFPRDNEGRLGLYHYQLKGYMKEIAGLFLKDKISRKSSLKHIISRYVDIYPPNTDFNTPFEQTLIVPFLRNGDYVTNPDGELTRPLRSFVRNQYIVTISKSDILNPPLEIAFNIVTFPEFITDNDILLIFQHGNYWGISQWRTARYGRFKILNIVKRIIKSKKNEAQEQP